MSQLDLFTDKCCAYCGGGGVSGRNPMLWNGFRDMDTGQLVCWPCKQRHYREKLEATYSEMPVYAQEPLR